MAVRLFLATQVTRLNEVPRTANQGPQWQVARWPHMATLGLRSEPNCRVLMGFAEMPHIRACPGPMVQTLLYLGAPRRCSMMPEDSLLLQDVESVLVSSGVEKGHESHEFVHNFIPGIG